MIKIFVEPTENLPEFLIVVDNLADGVEHISSLWHACHCCFFIYTVGTDHRSVIVDITAEALCIFISRLYSIQALHKKAARNNR